MKTFSKVVTLAAAAGFLGLGMISTTPAGAFEYGYDNRPSNDSGWRDRNGAGYADEGYDRSDEYGYDRPAPQPYGRPGYEVRSGSIAVCPPGYHLGRNGALCWPN